MPRKKKVTTEQVTPIVESPTAIDQLTQALAKAINLTKPVEKKTFSTRKPGSPWDKDGVKKLKLKRKMYQHGLMIDPDFIDNATIDALNHLKTGRYLNDWVKVYKRRDQGIEIDYPIKTASQRMKLPSMGITEQRDHLTGELIKSGLQVFVERMIEESKRPKPELPAEDLD